MPDHRRGETVAQLPLLQAQPCKTTGQGLALVMLGFGLAMPAAWPIERRGKGGWCHGIKMVYGNISHERMVN
ncbi:hypothetical protein THUN1379_12260 [Paludibacterium sp. THUN1379]|nr:hypothetical protein THUN1379_12260 [Paludibacterium sp. THUN1379]